MPRVELPAFDRGTTRSSREPIPSRTYGASVGKRNPRTRQTYHGRKGMSSPPGRFRAEGEELSGRLNIDPFSQWRQLALLAPHRFSLLLARGRAHRRAHCRAHHVLRVDRALLAESLNPRKPCPGPLNHHPVRRGENKSSKLARTPTSWALQPSGCLLSLVFGTLETSNAGDLEQRRPVRSGRFLGPAAEVLWR